MASSFPIHTTVEISTVLPFTPTLCARSPANSTQPPPAAATAGLANSWTTASSPSSQVSTSTSLSSSSPHISAGKSPAAVPAPAAAPHAPYCSGSSTLCSCALAWQARLLAPALAAMADDEQLEQAEAVDEEMNKKGREEAAKAKALDAVTQNVRRACAAAPSSGWLLQALLQSICCLSGPSAPLQHTRACAHRFGTALCSALVCTLAQVPERQLDEAKVKQAMAELAAAQKADKEAQRER